MLTREELASYLNTLLQVELFEDYCPNGLQIEGKSPIQKLATAVSASSYAIQEAKKRGVDALLVHHGLFWNRDPYVIRGVKKEKIATLLTNEISLFAYHLPLDAHPSLGNNWHAALQLGWSDLKPFCQIGVQGAFQPLAVHDFQKQLEKYYGHAAHTVLGGSSQVKSAALISGGAYKEISSAVKAGVDCFITGNFDEPVYHIAREEKINFLALGHAATERIGPRALGEHLALTFNIPVEFIDEDNPF